MVMTKMMTTTQKIMTTTQKMVTTTQRPITSAMTFVCVILTAVQADCPRPEVLLVGLLQPFEGEMGFERTAAAATMAIEDAQRNGILNGTEIKLIYRDDGCNGKTALGMVYDLLANSKVEAFFGLPCSAAAIDGGKLICYLNKTWISYYSPDRVMANQEVYLTLMRAWSTFQRMSTSLLKLFNYYQWNLTALVYMSSNECQYAADAVKEVLSACGVKISVEFNTADSADNSSVMAHWLKDIKMKARIVVLCGSAEFERQFILKAHELGMTNGDYVYITLNQMPPDNLRTPWINNDSMEAEEESRLAFSHVLQILPAFQIDDARMSKFLASIPEKMAQPPWNYSGTMEKGLTGSKFALFLYDAVYLYMSVTERLLRADLCDLNDGNSYQLFARRWSFEGITGEVVLDYNSDRIMDYDVWYLPKHKDAYELHMMVPMSKANSNVTLCTEWLSPILISEEKLSLPPDRPPCGFFGELCPQETSVFSTYMMVLTIIGALILVAVLTASAYFYRRQKFQEELAMMKWKVKLSDVVLVSNPTSRSLISIGKRTIGSGLDKGSNKKMSVVDEHKILIGSYNHFTVSMKFIDKENLSLAQADNLELKVMRELSHENLNVFVGLCIEPTQLCVLTVYCSRGSLQDILGDEHAKLDKNFQISFIGDLIKGMEYLHRSPLKYHGRLKTSNVLIDSRWTIKITDWGLARLRTSLKDTEDEDACFAMLWSAPEVLQQQQPQTNPPSAQSMQKADVYSFSIIIQEIIFRTGPFPIAPEVTATYKGIIKRVAEGEVPPLRPELLSTAEADVKLLELIKESWSEDPALRPTFTVIKNRFFGLYKGHQNIMDNMLKMMEKYAGNLEELVQERTQELEDEKKKTDMLLYNMLPQNVADKLKSGSNVHPETFPEVSIYFSDIVSFTSLAAESSPMQVVAVLNDLYITFDEVISMYNVYKVETIGDAYMVASGVPVANARHASEIASMSLSIRERVRSFKIRHRPNQPLEIRIGMNSGPVVAGIVGLKMPRYCLFGDTVNTASRMESTGKAMHIQLSESARTALEASGVRFTMAPRGLVEIKGKGMQTTYWLEGHASNSTNDVT